MPKAGSGWGKDDDDDYVFMNVSVVELGILLLPLSNKLDTYIYYKWTYRTYIPLS